MGFVEHSRIRACLLGEIRTCLLRFVHTINLNVCELARTVYCPESKLFFGYVIWVTYFRLHPHFAETQPLKGSLVNDLPVCKHVFMSQHGRYLTMVIDPPMRIALALSLESTFLGFHKMILGRKYDAFIWLQISISSNHIGIHSLLLYFILTIVHRIDICIIPYVFNVFFARVDRQMHLLVFFLLQFMHVVRLRAFH